MFKMTPELEQLGLLCADCNKVIKVGEIYDRYMMFESTGGSREYTHATRHPGCAHDRLISMLGPMVRQIEIDA